MTKFRAARVLYLSICHEHLHKADEHNAGIAFAADDPSVPHEGTQPHIDIELQYPALYEAIHRFGGFDELWKAIVPNLATTCPPGLRALCARIISR